MIMTAPVPTEEQEHLCLMDWINLHPLLREITIHIPNEGKRSFYIGKKLVKMGLRAGVSDLFIPYPNNGYHGLWLEVKCKNGHLTFAQIEWLSKMRKLGYAAETGFGFEACRAIIEDYMGRKEAA